MSEAKKLGRPVKVKEERPCDTCKYHYDREKQDYCDYFGKTGKLRPTGPIELCKVYEEK